MKDERSIDEHFETLLDLSVADHRKFLAEFKKRTLPKNSKNNNSNSNNNNNKNKGNQNKSNVLKPQNGKNNEKSFVAEKGNAKSTNAQVKSNNTKSATENTSTSTGAKKKTKYVNLYGEDGKMKDVIMLKGRHLCNCEASKHKLINNCIQCGRIVCEQEGSGPCLFCGNLVCTEDEQRLIESSSQNGENLKKSLLKQGRPKGWDEALAMRNRLLDYDRTSEKRTTVIDDESDYFRSNSVWLSDEERIKLKKTEEKMREKKHASRRDQKITIDFTGRQVIDEESMSAEFEREILQEVADTFAHSNQGFYSTDSNFDNPDDCDPNLTMPAPVVSTFIDCNYLLNYWKRDKIFAKAHNFIWFFFYQFPILFVQFDESVMIKVSSNNPKYDGVYNRVQDKELLEVSDMKKCMSMHQPWASLLIAGIKKHEGRSWYSSHRGRLWIASTAKPVDPDELKTLQNFYKKYYNGNGCSLNINSKSKSLLTFRSFADNSIEFPKQYPTASLLGCVLVQVSTCTLKIEDFLDFHLVLH